MCNKNCIRFAEATLQQPEIQGKKIIEVGSLNVNGTLRPLIESFKPKLYVGTDIVKGRGVDVVCRAEDLLHAFPKSSFDLTSSVDSEQKIESRA